jgi:hypothetical protein
MNYSVAITEAASIIQINGWTTSDDTSRSMIDLVARLFPQPNTEYGIMESIVVRDINNRLK